MRAACRESWWELLLIFINRRRWPKHIHVSMAEWRCAVLLINDPCPFSVDRCSVERGTTEFHGPNACCATLSVSVAMTAFPL